MERDNRTAQNKVIVRKLRTRKILRPSKFQVFFSKMKYRAKSQGFGGNYAEE